MTQPSGRTLETLIGPLAQTAPHLEPGTIQHADQLTTERRTNTVLRSKLLYTADSALYTLNDGEAMLYLGREQTNPVLNNIVEAAKQLLETGNYRPKPEDIEAVINAPDTLKVKLSDLKLRKLNGEVSYFEINTKRYNKLNAKQREVAERVYGQGDDFVKNMKMLKDEGMSKIRVYVLNPDYVKKNVQQDGAIARASWIKGFGGGSLFFADVGHVGGRNSLRGVRRVVAEAAYK